MSSPKTDDKILKGAQLEYLLRKLKQKLDTDEEAISDALIAIMQALELQADWEQSDNTAYDYIRNKPAITGSGNDVIVAGKAVIGAEPVNNMDVANKGYVDNQISANQIDLIVEVDQEDNTLGTLTVTKG